MSNPRLVFLDIDGVLNSREFIRRRWQRGDLQLDRRAVGRLSRLALETDAQIVVSSWWRARYSVTQLRTILREYGLDPSIRIAGFTPILPRQPNASGLLVAVERAVEIQQWLDVAATHSARPIRPHSLVIIDDERIAGELGRYQVLTDPEIGLTDADVERALTILGFYQND